MTLRPGFRFAVAPHFHLPADWPRRLHVGGIADDGSHGPWRPPTADELPHLVGHPAGGVGPDPVVELFRLPDHLRAKWWQLFERSVTAGNGHLPGFETFAGQLVDFLAFKEMPAPVRARCDVVVRRPGQWSALRSADGPSPWGAINLGDEATSVILTGPDSLPVRLTLESGEGYRLPATDLVVDGTAEDKSEPDVLLLITDPGPAARPPVARSHVRRVGDGIWTAGPLLGPEECSALIATAEARGYRSARMTAQGRNNSEVFLRLPDLSELILARLGEQTWETGSDFEVTAVAPVLEFYRYREGDSVAAHRDSPDDVAPGVRSDLTLVIYLNEGFSGGDTCFPDQALCPHPGLGEAVLFRHSLLHEGTPVREGLKYIVRTSLATSPSSAD